MLHIVPSDFMTTSPCLQLRPHHFVLFHFEWQICKNKEALTNKIKAIIIIFIIETHTACISILRNSRNVRNLVKMGNNDFSLLRNLIMIGKRRKSPDSILWGSKGADRQSSHTGEKSRPARLSEPSICPGAKMQICHDTQKWRGVFAYHNCAIVPFRQNLRLPAYHSSRESETFIVGLMIIFSPDSNHHVCSPKDCLKSKLKPIWVSSMQDMPV